MNRSELVKVLAEKSKIPLEEAELVVSTMETNMKETLLAGGRVEIRGFGSFKVKDYPGYTGRNPRTGEEVAVSAKRLPLFRAGKELRDYMNK